MSKTSAIKVIVKKKKTAGVKPRSPQLFNAMLLNPKHVQNFCHQSHSKKKKLAGVKTRSSHLFKTLFQCNAMLCQFGIWCISLLLILFCNWISEIIMESFKPKNMSKTSASHCKKIFRRPS